MSAIAPITNTLRKRATLDILMGFTIGVLWVLIGGGVSTWTSSTEEKLFMLNLQKRRDKKMLS